MAKRFVFILIMIAVLGSLGFALFVLNRKDSSPAPVVARNPIEYITSIEQIQSVTIQNADDRFTILGEAGLGLLSGYEEFDVNTFDLLRILIISGSLASNGTVTEEETDLAPFGLESPRSIVTIRPETGTETVLLIGNTAPDGNYNVYVKKEGSPAIYLASQGNVDNYLKSAFDFVNKEITPAGVDNGAGGFFFDRIVMGGAIRGNDEIVIVHNEADADSGGKSIIQNPYRIVRPVATTLNMDRGLPVLQALFGLTASRIAAKIDGSLVLGQYGLAEPYSRVAVSGTEGEGLGAFTISASKPDAAGNVYILREGTNLVYEMPASGLSWLETSWFDLMDRLIILPFIDSVASIDVKIPAKTATFSLAGESDELTVKAGSIDIDTAFFRSYYQTLISAMYDEYSEVPAASLSNPFVEISYHYRDGSPPDNVSFYSTESRRVLVSLNGGRPFFTLSVYTDKIQSDLDQILSGKRVQTYF